MWFTIACLAALLPLPTLALLRRDWTQQRYLRLMRERHAERARIARDLHDTLLQGVQALLFRLQVWETDPNLPLEHREEVAAVVNQARAVAVEGRERILMLRRTHAHPTDLLEALTQIGARESAANGPRFQITVVGNPRPVDFQALEQLIDIAREAIRNSFKHARALQVDVCVEYGKRSLILHVCDDGSGIELSALNAQAASGHFGLIGMRERAEQLGGRIRILRREPHGTAVRVSVPAIP